MIGFVGIGAALDSTKNNYRVTVTLPAGDVGDLMLLYVVNSYPIRWAAPSGWTAIESLTATNVTNNTTAAACFYRYAVSGDTSVTPTVNTTSNKYMMVAAVVRYSGVSSSVVPTTANRHGFISTATSESATSWVPPALSAQGPYDLVVNCYATGAANSTGRNSTDGSGVPGYLEFTGPPDGWTQRGNNIHGDPLSTGPTLWSSSSSAGFNCGMVIADCVGDTSRPTVTSYDSLGHTGPYNSAALGNWVVFSVALAAARPPGDEFMQFF